MGEVDFVPLGHGAQTRSAELVPCCATKAPGAQVAHAAHAGAFMLALNVPLSHATQPRSERGVASANTRCPARQRVASAHGVAGSLSWSQVPAAQASLGAPAPAQYSPASQASQSEGPPPGRSTVPAAHVPFGVHAAWLADIDSVPSAHGEHCLSLVVEPGALTNEPGAQSRQASQRNAPAEALKCPLGHAAQLVALAA